MFLGIWTTGNNTIFLSTTYDNSIYVVYGRELHLDDMSPILFDWFIESC